MGEHPAAALSPASAPIDACWNRIGVRGDKSCPELTEHVHCRNCPVYSAGAAALLDAEAPAGYVAERTAHFAEPARAVADQARSVAIFRVASEWLALPAALVVEVANLLPIHSLPHRPSAVVLGLASVRGELLICVSLGQVVGAEPLTAPAREVRGKEFRRLLVIRRDAVRVACPVDEVHGIHRFHPRELIAVPATVARATVTYSTALLSWQGHSVSVLDDQLLFYAIKRSLG